MRATVVSSLDEIGLDACAWSALAAQSDTNSVFQTYEWMQSWWAVFRSEYEPLFVTVANESGLCGVAPMIVLRRSHDRIVRFLGDGRADYCDFLTCGDKAAVLESILDALLAGTRWDVIELNNVPGSSRTIEMLRTICQARGYPMLAQDHYVCPTLLIDGHEAAARQILNKPSVRRRQKFFTRSGALTFHHLRDATAVEPHLERFFAQHIARWAGSDTPSLFLEPRNRAFYRELTVNLARRGWLLFSLVEFDGRPIAYHYGFDYNQSVIWYKPSFDTAFAQYSPGIVMVGHLISYALEQRRRELDFTIGDEPFKQRFTNCSRKTMRIQIFRSPLRFLAHRSRQTLARTLKKLAG